MFNPGNNQSRLTGLAFFASSPHFAPRFSLAIIIFVTGEMRGIREMLCRNDSMALHEVQMTLYLVFRYWPN